MADAKITKSTLNIGSISEVLKRSQSDFSVISSKNTYRLANLCTHENINKWARYKPIHHSGLFMLTDEERKDRIGDGEFYGVICRQTNMNLGSLNNVTFGYNRPTGGSASPFRLGDFINSSLSVGYNHLARPNVVGRLSWSTKWGEGYFDLDGNNNVYCNFYLHTPDSSEIDLSEIYTDRGVQVSIKDMYPVFMFGTSETNMWVIAMRRLDTYQPAKIGDAVDANGIPTTSFFASFHSYYPPQYIIEDDTTSGDTSSSSGTTSNTTVQDTAPDNFPTNTTKAEVDVVASIGLVTSLAYTGLYDFNYWNEMSDNVTTNFALGVPSDPSVMSYGLCGMNVKLKAKNADKFLYMTTSVGTLALNVGLSRFFESLSDFNAYVLPDSGNITINAYVSFDGGVGVAKSKTVELKGSNLVGTDIFGGVTVQYKYSASAIFQWTEWGIVGGLSEGTVVYMRVTATGIYDGVSIEIAKKEGTYTITDSSSSSKDDPDITDTTPSLSVDLQDQWQASSVAITGYTVYESFSNYNVNSGLATIKLTIVNKPDFKLYINSYAESSYDYTIAWELDTEPASSPQYSSTGVKAHTRANQQDPTGGISAFTEVDYSNDGGTHTIYITYRKDSTQNSNNDKGYIAIPN